MSEEEIIDILNNLEFDEEWWLLNYPEQDKVEDLEAVENAIQGLLDLYNKEKEKNKELENDNTELRRLKNKLSIATAIALDGRQISISKKSLNELNDMFSIEVEYRPLYDDYVFYAK